MNNFIMEKKKLNLKETSAIKYFRKYPEEATRGVL